MSRRKRARDYGDSKRIRHSKGEHKNVHRQQYWETYYAKNRGHILRQRKRRSHGIL